MTFLLPNPDRNIYLLPFLCPENIITSAPTENEQIIRGMICKKTKLIGIPVYHNDELVTADIFYYDNEKHAVKLALELMRECDQ